MKHSVVESKDFDRKDALLSSVYHMLTFLTSLQLTPGAIPILRQCFRIPVQFHYFRVCLRQGKRQTLVWPCYWSQCTIDPFYDDVIWGSSPISCCFCVIFLKAKTNLSAAMLVSLLKCQLDRQQTYSTGTWKLFFQKSASVLEQALLDFSSMVCTCHAVEALQKCSP